MLSEFIAQRVEQVRQFVVRPRNQLALSILAGAGLGVATVYSIDGPITDPLTSLNRQASERYREIDLKPPEWNPGIERRRTLELIDTLK